MVDFHSHVLPGIDDGSKDIEESIKILRKMQKQGIDTVVATPHFYPTSESPESFLEKRKKALESLLSETKGSGPRIIPGAEVYYFNGISRMKGLERLRIQGTDILLLEMPFSEWDTSMISDVYEISQLTPLRVMLAHIDRYFKFQKSSVWDDFSSSGVLFQVNADSLLEFFPRHRILKLFKEERINALGSDCHNLTTRPPKLDEAVEMVRKKLGNDFWSVFDRYTHDLLSEEVDG